MGPVRRVCVHVGPPKTGTTFVQSVLRANAAQLAAEGYVHPRGHRQHGSVRQLFARMEADPADGSAGVAHVASAPNGWDRLVHRVATADAHTAIVSVEGLARATPGHVQAVVACFAPASVHVVYGARDLATVVPAAWQSRLRTGEAPTWREFVESVRNPGGDDSYGSRFWFQHDPRRVLGAWLEHVPADRIHVVTVPPSGESPRRLWERFCRVIGLSADGYDLDVPRANLSLGGVEAEVLRRLTGQVSPLLDESVFATLVKHFVARDVLERREQSFRLVLPERERRWLRPRSEAVIDYLRTGGFDVVGDLAELLSVPAPAGRDPDDVSDAETLAVMSELLGTVVVELARATTRRPAARVDEGDA